MRSPSMTFLARSAAIAATLATGVLLLAATGSERPKTDPITALNQGNQLFRDGQVETAIEAYEAGYSPHDPHPTLLYNLGTALHHAGRLPEAILWYRRAAGSDDPWLTDNLWLARRSLGSQTLPPSGPLGWLVRQGVVLRSVAVGLAWVTLVLLIGVPRVPRWALAAAGALSLVIYGAAVVGSRWGPHLAVLLAECPTPNGPITAGTEVWVRHAGPDHWRLSSAGGALSCPADTVALVFPEP